MNLLDEEQLAALTRTAEMVHRGDEGFALVQVGMSWYGMVWYGMAWHGMAWYGMVWYGMAWYGVGWGGV